MIVKFCQLTRRQGRGKIIYIDLNNSLNYKIVEILNSGLRLTAEVLKTGECVFCIENLELGNFDSEICNNALDVLPKIEQLIQRFDSVAYQEWLAHRQ